MDRRSSPLPAVDPVDSLDEDLTALSLADLRERRRVARGRLEFAQLRMRQSVDVDESTVSVLHGLVERLTDELIARYEREPELIDTILDAPSAREVSRS
jgi:hypothetical protein